jgi:hypothetical protein
MLTKQELRDLLYKHIDGWSYTMASISHGSVENFLHEYEQTLNSAIQADNFGVILESPKQ